MCPQPIFVQNPPCSQHHFVCGHYATCLLSWKGFRDTHTHGHAFLNPTAMTSRSSQRLANP